MQKHNSSHFNIFTAKYRPWVLSAVVEAGTVRGEAEKFEKFIKKQKGGSRIKKLIDPNFKPDGKLCELVRVPHVLD